MNKSLTTDPSEDKGWLKERTTLKKIIPFKTKRIYCIVYIANLCYGCIYDEYIYWYSDTGIIKPGVQQGSVYGATLLSI